MKDTNMDAFEAWLISEVAATLPQDNGFTQTVMARIPEHTVIQRARSDPWNSVSLGFCLAAIGALLFQTASQIEPSDLSGPLAQSLVLTAAMIMVSWQLQKELTL
ncbi:MAG: hypothetical protein ACOYL0_01920 [Limnohabitans sp.]|nr:hypothetical protein [Burkholderiales bacterium]